MSNSTVLSQCHPERLHYGKGLCEPCYLRTPRVREASRLRSLRYYAKVGPGKQAEYYKRNRDRHLSQARMDKYGLSGEEYNAVVKGAACGVCGTKAVRMCLDHCHATGRIRGPLCYNCNRGLGAFGDSSNLMAAAVRYLEKYDG